MQVAPLINNLLASVQLVIRHEMIPSRGDTPIPTIDVQIQVVQGNEVAAPNLRIPRVLVRLFGNHRRRIPVNPAPPLQKAGGDSAPVPRRLLTPVLGRSSQSRREEQGRHRWRRRETVTFNARPSQWP